MNNPLKNCRTCDNLNLCLITTGIGCKAFNMWKKKKRKCCNTCQYKFPFNGKNKCGICENFNKWEQLPNPKNIDDEIEITIGSLPPNMANCALYEMQPSVHESVLQMYDRYYEAYLILPIKQHTPEMMSLTQFFDMIFVAGLVNYNDKISELEEEINKL